MFKFLKYKKMQKLIKQLDYNVWFLGEMLSCEYKCMSVTEIQRCRSVINRILEQVQTLREM